MTTVISVDLDALDRFCMDQGIGTDAELAYVLGMTPGSISRIRSTSRVGKDFIARALYYLPLPFDSLFSVDVEEKPVTEDIRAWVRRVRAAA